jgi:hypothetical protein
VFSFAAGALEELPFVAAAFLCALLPKNASMVVVASKYFQLNGWNIGLGTGLISRNPLGRRVKPSQSASHSI